MKTAIVTGGAQGIGKGVTQALLAQGWRVVVLDRDRGALADLAAEIGLDRAEALDALESGRFAGDVAADIAQAQAYGIQGVPFFVIDGKYGVSGAQEAETFANVLTQVASEKESVR